MDRLHSLRRSQEVRQHLHHVHQAVGISASSFTNRRCNGVYVCSNCTDRINVKFPPQLEMTFPLKAPSLSSFYQNSQYMHPTHLNPRWTCVLTPYTFHVFITPGDSRYPSVFRWHLAQKVSIHHETSNCGAVYESNHSLTSIETRHLAIPHQSLIT